MTSIEKALIEIASFCSDRKIPYMVIGGIANIFWGSPRATLDIDVTVMVQDERIDSIVDDASRTFEVLVGNPRDFIKETRVLPLKVKNGIRVDLIFGQLPFEEDAIKRAVLKKVEGHDVAVCTAEDLIVHKIISERPKDREDVKELIRRQGDSLDRTYLNPLIEGLANDLTRPDILDFYRSCF